MGGRGSRTAGRQAGGPLSARRQSACASTATTPRRSPSIARRALSRSGPSATSATWPSRSISWRVQRTKSPAAISGAGAPARPSAGGAGCGAGEHPFQLRACCVVVGRPGETGVERRQLVEPVRRLRLLELTPQPVVASSASRTSGPPGSTGSRCSSVRDSYTSDDATAASPGGRQPVPDALHAGIRRRAGRIRCRAGRAGGLPGSPGRARRRRLHEVARVPRAAGKRGRTCAQSCWYGLPPAA